MASTSKTPNFPPASALLQSEAPFNTSKQIAEHLRRHNATLVKARGALAISLKGSATLSETPIPYHLIPGWGTLAQSSKWVKLAPSEQLQLIASRLTAAAAQAFHEAVQSFVFKTALRAGKAGLDGTWLWSALVCAHELAEHRFQVVYDRIDSASSAFQARDTTLRTKNTVDLTRYPESYALAASMRRKLVAYLGPTNSGKTHRALQALSSAKSGVYLAPLRLLALENFERLQNAGVTANLVTGEERRVFTGATHTASTVEMMDSAVTVEVAVIDEIQMLGDPDRGSAWTAAVCGVPAETVYLVGSATARNAIEALARRLGCDLEVHLLERKAPLTLEPSAVGGIKALRKGDALIAFSRKDVLSWAEQLTRAGFSVATIYGNLSPEVRQAQAAAFRNGIADIIVGTDAIGMGLNLPIARVVFTTALKYDGYDEAQIPAWLAQQIGGRAGRFGLHEAGAVAGFDAATHRAIGKLLKAQLDNLPSAGFYVSPTVEHLKQLADETGENKLEKLLTIFKRNIDLHDDFFLPTWLAEQLERAAWLDGLRLTLEERFLFSLVPLTLRVPAMKTSFEAWARNVERNQKSGLPHRLLGTKLADLQQAEDACKEYSGYAWLSYRMPSLFPDGSAAVALAQQASMAVHRILLVQNTTRKQKTSKGSVLSYLK